MGTDPRPHDHRSDARGMCGGLPHRNPTTRSGPRASQPPTLETFAPMNDPEPTPEAPESIEIQLIRLRTEIELLNIECRHLRRIIDINWKFTAQMTLLLAGCFLFVLV